MKLRMYEISQQLRFIDDIGEFVSKIDGINAIEKYAWIIHNKDVKEDGTPVAEHIHLYLRLKNAYDSKYVAEWFGVPEQCLEKIKGRFKDALKYMTHKNAPNKYQYSDDKVMSNFNWIEEREKVDSNKRVEDIINGIVDLKIREYNIDEFLTPVEEVKYSRQICEAYKIRDRKLLLKGDRKMECLFVTGKSGSGKTTYAKSLAKEKGYSYFVSGSSNDALDGYLGQDCIILDDLRSSSFSLSDLLKMLDNNTNSSVKSRYKNKVLQCKLLIITSIMDIDEFYKNVFESDREPILQFKRRCRVYVKMDDDNMYMRVFHDDINDYGPSACIPNPIALMYPKKERTAEDDYECIKRFTIGFNDHIVNNKEQIISELSGLKRSNDGDCPF